VFFWTVFWTYVPGVFLIGLPLSKLFHTDYLIEAIALFVDDRIRRNAPIPHVLEMPALS